MLTIYTILLIHFRTLDHKNDTNEEPLKCENCDATFKSSTQLKRHTANAHCSRPFKCPHCPHRSKNRTNLERHVAFHTSNKDAFQCLHCGRKFAFKNSMKKHLEKGRCTVLKELEKAEKEKNNGIGTDNFKNFLEATIMRHLQQTPKSPPLLTSLALPQFQAPSSVVLPNSSSSSSIVYSQTTHTKPQQLGTDKFFTMIQGNREDSTMDTTLVSSISNPTIPKNHSLLTLNSTSSIPSSSPSNSSYINTASSNIFSDRNLQSLIMANNNENHVPNDILYQFDTASCNSNNNNI